MQTRALEGTGFHRTSSGGAAVSKYMDSPFCVAVIFVLINVPVRLRVLDTLSLDVGNIQSLLQSQNHSTILEIKGITEEEKKTKKHKRFMSAVDRTKCFESSKACKHMGH